MNFLASVIWTHCNGIKGVLHIGAHYGEEIFLFSALRVVNQVFFEPVPSVFEILRKYVNNTHPTYQIALGNINKEMEMFVDTTKGLSSSILKPEMHLIYYPEVLFNEKITVQVRRLDDIISEGLLDPSIYNFMLVDVQGYELEVLKGAKEFIDNHVNYIFCEVNNTHLYENGCLIEEIDAFLCVFKRVETTPWNVQGWGDALYVRGGV